MNRGSQQAKASGQRALLWIALGILGAILLLRSVGSADAQDVTPTRTPDPRSTIWTPPPTRYAIELLTTREIDDLNWAASDLGSMATDSDGNLYIGDGKDTVLVLASDLSEIRRFKAQQPYALALNQAGELLIAQRFGTRIDVYSLNGDLLRGLWQQPDAKIEALTVAPDGSVYVMWQRLNPPMTAVLTQLNARGNVLYTRDLLRAVGPDDSVHALVFAPDGNLNITLTGYNFGESFRAVFLTYTALGDPVRRRYPLPFVRAPIPPAPMVRLPDGDLVMFTSEFVTWWDTTETIRAQYVANDFRRGIPINRFARRAALAAHPTRPLLYIAEVKNTGELHLGVMALVDREAPTATPEGGALP